MKTIVKSEDQKTILQSRLIGSEIVAYRCPDSESICLLSKITKNNKPAWGFINIQYPNSNPTFCGETFYEAINSSIRSRTVIMFNNQRDLIEAVYHKKF